MLHPTACPSQAAFPVTCDNSLTWGSRSPLTQREQTTLFQQSTTTSDLEVLTLIVTASHLTACHPSARWKLLANEAKSSVIRKKKSRDTVLRFPKPGRSPQLGCTLRFTQWMSQQGWKLERQHQGRMYVWLIAKANSMAEHQTECTSAEILGFNLPHGTESCGFWP